MLMGSTEQFLYDSLASLLDTLFESRRSGRSIVLAIAITISLELGKLGHSKKL